MFLKNSDGQPSFSFTMVAISFASVTLWLLLSIVTTLGPLHIRPFSGAEAMAYLSPIFALYYGRRGQTTAVNDGVQAVTGGNL